MAPRRAKVNKLDYKKLSTDDVICPICRSILIKPVTLPCNHGFCFACFETTQNSSVVCPLCRVRVGSWLRSATKSKKLVNETLWEAIQLSFPLQVKNRLHSVNENCGAKHKKANEENQNKNNNLVKSNVQLNLHLEKNDLKLRYVGDVSVTKEVDKSDLSTLAPALSKTNTSTCVKTSSKSSSNPITAVDFEKCGNHFNTFLNNFATKEYTCRILCQNENSKQKIFKESQVLLQKKNKRILEIAQLEKQNERSNSIESECLYFKPIDYRHNPPSEGLPPIKVPTRKPNITTNVKILAPTGQNQINVNYLESAFVRLCSPMLSEKEDAYKKENLNSRVQRNNPVESRKRKLEIPAIKAKRKMKNVCSSENQTLKTRESNKTSSICDISKCSVSLNSDVKSCTKVRSSDNALTEDELIKRSLQEKADFELATKLQQTFNQSCKYSTRSTVLKRMATKSQVKMNKIMTPYKVK